MAKYKAYPKYKDSGVEWLGTIPTDWKVSRIKEIADVNNGFPFSSSQFHPTEGFPLVRIRDINSKRTEVFFNGYVPSEAKINNGDVLIGMDGDFNVSWWNNGEAALNQRVACIRSNSILVSRFIYYCLPFNMKIINDLTYFTTVKHLSNFDILKAKLALPSRNDIKSIVGFLDHETKKIDKLIEKQRQLIELLKEKRQAVISHAVTKGLNPDVQMKDSGVEWLGEVPKNWTVMQMRHAIVRIEQGKSPECEARNAENEEWGVLKSGCVNGGIFNEKEHKALPVSIIPNIEYEVHPGDLIMSRASGSIDLIGSMAFIYSCRERLLLSDKTFRIIPKKKMSAEFLSLLMGALPMRNQIKLAINGAEGLANNITKESIKSFYIVAPCFSEQADIVSLIIRKNKTFDQLEIKLTNYLKFLQERRTALISAAVTGKIDVRDWVAPETQEVEKPQESTA